MNTIIRYKYVNSVSNYDYFQIILYNGAVISLSHNCKIRFATFDLLNMICLTEQTTDSL